MRHLVVAFGLLSVAITVDLKAEDANRYPRATEQNNQNFLQSLQNEIKKQEDLVNAIKVQVERTDIVPDGSIVAQFDNAYTMLNVKKTLYANFQGTPSINSPLIQQQLLAIFKKDIISPADLASLGELVKEERPKYTREAQPAKEAAAPPSAARPAMRQSPQAPLNQQPTVQPLQNPSQTQSQNNPLPRIEVPQTSSSTTNVLTR